MPKSDKDHASRSSPFFSSQVHDDVRDESLAALFGLLGRVCSECGSVDLELKLREHMFLTICWSRIG